MSSASNTLNTLYGPYRTPEAITRAPNADFIPLDGDRNINAVHPIPVDWLREELLPRERDRVRAHVAQQINGLQSRVSAYADALRATMANLNSVNNMSTATRGIPFRHVAPNEVDGLTEGFGNLTTGQPQTVLSPPRGARLADTLQEQRVLSPTRGVRFAEDVQTDRVPQDFRVSDPYSPPPSSPPPRGILRSPGQSRGHFRTSSATSTMGFQSAHERNVREPSPTVGLLDELAALDVQLDEIHGKVNDPTSIIQGAAKDRRNENIATARSNIRRLRGLRPLSREDVDETRAGVHSVMTAAGRDEGELPVVHGDRRGGRGSRARPISNVPSAISEQVRLATYQQQQREYAYSIGAFPVWRSPPVDPQRGDILECLDSLDGELRRYNSRGSWQLFDPSTYGRMLYRCS
jgi:hypothetical protein